MKQYIIINTSWKHVNYEEDKNKVPMNKPYNIQNTIICKGIFVIKIEESLLFLCVFLLILQERFRLRCFTKLDQNEWIIILFVYR
jgi:hypothetical protein